jgi:beta-glucosidase
MKVSQIKVGTLPKDFIWGAATSSYQIEGGVASGDRGRCIWDDMCDTPGKISDATQDCVGVDHLIHWEDDLDLIKSLNLDSYRFSISWPRVQHGGRGAFNESGIDFYNSLIDGLIARGIEPNITLYHWDLPSELQAIGGWANPEVVDLFAAYAGEMAKRFGSKVKFWATLNEPWCSTYLGYLEGVHAPGIQDFTTTAKVAHQLVRAHALASKAIKDNAPQALVGVVLNLADQRFIGEITLELQSEMDLIDSYQNLWWLQGMLQGTYPANLLNAFERIAGVVIDESDIPDVTYGRDWIGINYYSGQVFQGGGKGIGIYPGTSVIDGAPWGSEKTDIGWNWTPDGLKKLLIRVNELFPQMPIYITENGACYNTDIGADGKIDDVKRQEYMAEYISEALKSLDEGVNLKGYYAWSLLDNFEWAWGFSMRFGIVHVDFKTMKRTIKESGHQYGKLATSL